MAGPRDLALGDQQAHAFLFRCCYAGLREIHMAAWHVARGHWADVIDTLRHEAAHAFAGKNAGHGPAWWAWARCFGAEPKRCGSEKAWAKSPAANDGPKWIVTCRKCGARVRRRRRSAGWLKLRHRGCEGRLQWMQIR